VHVFATGTVGYDPDRDGVEAVKIDDILTVARTNTPSPITRCAIVLTVRHEIQGRIDPAFHGGSAVGAVIREVNLDYIPR
jgi:deoxycytidine triphosphate deaminase